MRLFSGLYARVMIWARHKYATYWLALVSFTESSCFLVPPDVMLAPMTLARPERAWFLAMLTTVTSVLGGLLGYFIGLFAFNMAEPLLISLGYMDAYIHAAVGYLGYISGRVYPHTVQNIHYSSRCRQYGTDTVLARLVCWSRYAFLFSGWSDALGWA